MQNRIDNFCRRKRQGQFLFAKFGSGNFLPKYAKLSGRPVEVDQEGIIYFELLSPTEMIKSQVYIK